MAVTQDGRIVVADYRNHRLQVLTAEGAFIATVGSEGYPYDVAVDHNGKSLSLSMVTIVSRSSMLTSPTRTALVAKSSRIHVV